MDNKMTFFSGTDTGTLREEGMDRNHFVSLIVNNEGTYTAAITRKVKSSKTITDNFVYPSFEDKVISDNKVYTSENEELEWYYLKIEFERNGTFYEPLKGRLSEIKKLKEEKAKKAKSIPTITSMYPGRPLQSYPQTDKPIIQQSYKSTVGQGNIIKKEDKELPFDWDFIDNKINDDIPYRYIQFNKKIIKSLVLQLITGSIIIPNESKIDAKKWAKGMTPIFKKRFGEGEHGLKLFRAWADVYIEYLCWFTEDDDLIKLELDDDTIASICARDIIEALTKLPTNEYIKIYIDILEGYLI